MSEENILNNYLVGRSILSFLINKHNKHGIFKTSDYDLNLKKRKAKYKGFKNILCEECNENIDKQGCYCVNCYKNETEIYKRNHMRYGLNFGIFKTLDYDLNLKERRKKYYDHDYILCEECNLEIDKRYYYCKHCYDRDAICTQNTFKVGIFKTSDYDLNLKERKVKYEDFRVILCEECGQEIYKHCYYCTICYKKHGINEKNHMKYGSNFGIFTVNNYLLLNWNERQVKFKCFDVVLCGKCNIKIDKLYYYCVRCFNHEAENHRKYNFKVGVFKTSDYDLNLKKRKAKYKDFKNILCEECDKKFDKECYYCIDCYKNEPECYKQNHMKYGLNFGIYKTLDYDLNLKERRKKFYDYDYILCEKCNQVIDKRYYYCKYCYDTDDDEIHINYEFKVGIFKTLDYDLNLKERKVKYDNYDQIICGECKQGIAKHYYYCLVCYNIKTDINEQSHMKYGLNFGIFKITDYDLNLEKRKTKYKNFKIILCEKCNQEIDNQYYCKNCFVKETNYSKKFRMKCVFKTGILETSDYDLNVKERQAKFESYDIIKCEKCNYEINNFYNYRCDECYSKADKYERKRMTFGICKYCSEINAECGCLYSLNQLLKEFKNFNESKVNGNAITMTISDYDLNEDDRRAKYKDYNHILCEKCNKMFTYNYCHDCVAEKKQKLKKLQTELQIYENFYNKLYDRITNKLKISEELQLIIRNNEYIYSKIKRFEGTYLQIKIVIEYIMSIKRELIRIKQVPEICFHNARSYCVCYNMETDINEKNRMEFGKCKECLRIHEDLNGCLSCNPKRFQRDFNKWTSGNEVIDRLIQNNQLVARRYGILEWIPYDKFTNVNYVAEGGFAKVYSATWIDGQIKRWSQLSDSWRRNGSTTIALKVLNNSENISEDLLNELKFFNEVSGHMCVIKCFGITQDPVTYDYALVLQYMENGDLRKYLKRTANIITWDQRLNKIYDICLALNNIHVHGLIHKDLHPGNIFIDSTFAYIGDFGFCMPANENLSNSTNKNIYGVMSYMAPEILRGKPHTLASDVYSLGVILNEIITVIPPFNNQPHDQYLALDICRGLRPNIKAETPYSLKELIEKCWNANPEDRPASKEILYLLSDKLSEYKKMPIRLSYNLNESNELQSHPQAIYKSRLLNFQNLPEPINCPNHQEFVSSRHIMKIQTGQVNTLHSDGCSDCIIDGTQV